MRAATTTTLSLLFGLAFVLAGPRSAAQPAPSAREDIHPLLAGPVADFRLPDWAEVSAAWRALADASPRVQLETAGRTTEGRDFLVAVVSSEQNLAQLERIRADNARLADPRGQSSAELEALVGDGPVTVMISLAMHSTETAAPQFGLRFAERLANSDEEPWRSAREHCVVVILPCSNPDGLDEVSQWYHATVGTPHEASELPRLYQLYAGHDNNRDWFLGSLAETRLISGLLYEVWRPQIYWDVHQQGSDRERMFVPPYRDPLDPNLDPALIGAIDALGSRALFDLTAEGLTGVSSGVTYDMWWNGGNRNVPVRNNIVGLLTEAASVDLASPVFRPFSTLRPPSGLPAYAPSHRFPAPWPGGWWRLADIVDYELAFGRSLLASLSREPATWRGVVRRAAERAVRLGHEERPAAWVVPRANRDPDAVARLVGALLMVGTEIHASAEPLELDGRTHAPGSLVILRAQPAGQHVKDLLELQTYPEGDPPYDVAGWTLPALLGVECVEASVAPPIVRLARVHTTGQALAGWSADAAESTASDHLPRTSADWRLRHAAAARGEGEALPRVGVYAPWRGNMDEGWTRWVLEQHGRHYVTVRNEDLAAGALHERFDVLLFPDIDPRSLVEGRGPGRTPVEYRSGLGAAGEQAVADFVRGGGRLVTVARASLWAIDLFGLPLASATAGEAAAGFSCPGSVLRTRVEPGAPGWVPSAPGVFFSRDLAFEDQPGDATAPVVSTLLRYAPERTLWSGWIAKPEVIAGKSALVAARVGQGQVVLFGFRPAYRSWTQAAFPMLFGALDGSELP